MRDATGSIYDRFWQCMFGWQPTEPRRDEGDVPLARRTKTALGMAEESQPLDYGSKGSDTTGAPQRGAAEHGAPHASEPRRSATEKT